MAGSPTNLRPIVHIVINILFALGESSALLRLFCKRFLIRQFGLDDWAMTAVSMINIAQHAILYLFMSAGAGLPQTVVLAKEPGVMTRMLKYLFAEEIWYLFLHFWIKMSFLLFFLRLSPKKSFRRAVFVVIGINIFVTIGTWILYSLQCIPLDAYWSPELHPDVKCLAFSLSLWLPACALIAVDFMIFFLPLSTVWGLKMGVRRRLQILAVVTTGGSSVLVSCLRLIVIDRFTKLPDFIWEMGNICIVSSAEMNVAIFAANMPGMHAMWRHFRGGSESGIGSSAQKSSGAHGSRAHELVTFGGSGAAKVKRSRGTQRLPDEDDDDEYPAMGPDHSSTRELNRKGGSDEDVAGITVKTRFEVEYSETKVE